MFYKDSLWTNEIWMNEIYIFKENEYYSFYLSFSDLRHAWITMLLTLFLCRVSKISLTGQCSCLLPWQQRSWLVATPFQEWVPIPSVVSEKWGSSGKELTYTESNDLMRVISSIGCRLAKITFHNQGPKTANELSKSVGLCWLHDFIELLYSRVLDICCATLSTCG